MTEYEKCSYPACQKESESCCELCERVFCEDCYTEHVCEPTINDEQDCMDCPDKEGNDR